jgi:hypothetical protein
MVAASRLFPIPLHTLSLTVGGITRKPGLVDDRDVADGAPAARFARHLRELVEGAVVPQDLAR